MELFIALCLAIGLAACSGLRAFLPLFLVGMAVRMQFPVMLGGSQEAIFLASDFALVSLGVLSLAEIFCDMVPFVDHAMQVPYFVIRPLSGAVVAMTCLDGIDPGLFYFFLVISTLLGILVSLPVHTTSATIRVVSTATTAGTVNPLLSIKETLLVLFGVAAFLVLAPLALAALVLGGVMLFGWLTRMFQARKRMAHGVID